MAAALHVYRDRSRSGVALLVSIAQRSVPMLRRRRCSSLEAQMPHSVAGLPGGDQGGHERRTGSSPPKCGQTSSARRRPQRTTSASEIGRPPPMDVPPDAATTTYCTPSLPMQVIGVECALAGSVAVHSSARFASNAKPSVVGRTDEHGTLAVAILPPRFRVPDLTALHRAASDS